MHALVTSTPVTSLSICNGLLALGTEDGEVAVYDLNDPTGPPTPRNVNYSAADEIASLSWVPFKTDANRRELWTAAGNQLSRLDLTEPSIEPLRSAVEHLHPLRDAEDVISKITVNDAGTHLAYATDDGQIGVISLLLDRRKTVMRTSHTSICDCVVFLPSACPWQLISAGYDYRILHHDFSRGTLSSDSLLEGAAPSDSTVSLSPPFIHSVSLSSEGDLACGLGTGEVYLSHTTVNGPKRDKKGRWLGLKERGARHQAAEGPIVGIQHLEEGRLLVSSLLGNLSLFDTRPAWELVKKKKMDGIAKVNAMTCDRRHVILAGVTAEGKGVVELLDRDSLK